jgi:hypothetical protein
MNLDVVQYVELTILVYFTSFGDNLTVYNKSVHEWVEKKSSLFFLQIIKSTNFVTVYT